MTILIRHLQGEVLRDLRNEQNMTLREVSAAAKVALGYISEVERGHKEASSEVMFSILEALDVTISEFLQIVSDRFRELEPVRV